MDKRLKITLVAIGTIILVSIFIVYSMVDKEEVGVSSVEDNIEQTTTPQDPPKYIEDYATGECIYPDGRSLRPYSRCQDVKYYNSQNLGVSFSVHQSATITEEGNRIFIDGSMSDQKDFVEIFEKPAVQTLSEKVKELMKPTSECRIINGYSEAGFRDDGEYVAFPATYSGLTLKASIRDESDSEPLQCESEFAVVNQNNLFLADSNIPTKVAFFNFRDGWIPSGEKLWWWQTFRFIK